MRSRTLTQGCRRFLWLVDWVSNWPGAPMWVFLPAVLPNAARAWVRDRSTHDKLVSHNGEPNHHLPWAVADASHIKQDMNSSCEECGLTPHCESDMAAEITYRLSDLEETLDHVWSTTMKAGMPIMGVKRRSLRTWRTNSTKSSARPESPARGPG